MTIGLYRPALLDTDVDIGAVLSQVQQGTERVSAYGSRKLSKLNRITAPHGGNCWM